MTKSNLIRAEAQRVAADIAQATAGSACLSIWLPGDPAPYPVAIGNTAAFASMLRNACHVAMKLPRPEDCKICGEAWDAIQIAELALTALPEGPCN